MVTQSERNRASKLNVRMCAATLKKETNCPIQLAGECDCPPRHPSRKAHIMKGRYEILCGIEDDLDTVVLLPAPRFLGGYRRALGEGTPEDVDFYCSDCVAAHDELQEQT